MTTTVLDSYYYDEQLRNYIVQFAAIFAGMQVMVGWNEDRAPELIRVPIKNASMDRVVAAIKSENTQNKPVRVPIMSFQLSGIDMAPERRKGIGATKRNTYMPTGGVFPDDLKVVYQRQPVPYTAQFELGIWTSNQYQHQQIIEQILTLFDPLLQIQTTDEVFDTTRLTTVEMVDVRFDENLPAGADRRLIQTRIGFLVPIYLSTAIDVRSNYIKDIMLRIGAIGSDVTNSYEIISDLDSQGIEYDKVFSLDDIDVT
jgi:hypothetical protein